MRPFRYALLLAGAFLAVAGTYIVVSDRLAEAVAATVGDLGAVETLKGIAFVLLTSVLLFAVSLWLFRRLQRTTRALETQSRALVESQQRALVGLLAASVAHDFNNVLMVISASATRLGRQPGLDADAQALLQDILRGAERGGDLARRLASAGRDAALDRRTETDLVGEVEACLQVVRGHAMVRPCRVEVIADPPERASVYPGLVYQMVANLVVNAGEATGGHGHIEVRIVGEPAAVRLEVHDDGPGIPEPRRAEVLEPFFTTKAEGTGLGLLSVRTCARLHGGSVEIGTSDLGGARVTVRLPRGEVPVTAAA